MPSCSICLEFNRGAAGHFANVQARQSNVLCVAVSQMIRDAAAGRVGPVTRIGVGTYVDEKVRSQQHKLSMGSVTQV